MVLHEPGEDRSGLDLAGPKPEGGAFPAEAADVELAGHRCGKRYTGQCQCKNTSAHKMVVEQDCGTF